MWTRKKTPFESGRIISCRVQSHTGFVIMTTKSLLNLYRSMSNKWQNKTFVLAFFPFYCSLQLICFHKFTLKNFELFITALCIPCMTSPLLQRQSSKTTTWGSFENQLSQEGDYLTNTGSLFCWLVDNFWYAPHRFRDFLKKVSFRIMKHSGSKNVLFVFILAPSNNCMYKQIILKNM